jgi:hypothetical protein
MQSPPGPRPLFDMPARIEPVYKLLLKRAQTTGVRMHKLKV